MKDPRGRIGRLGIVAIALLLAAGTAVPVAAGGWASIELDAWPEDVVAGQPITIGFQVLQHGISPVEDDTPRLVGIHRATGEQFFADGKAEGAAGHYVATATFPRAGAWKWSITSLIFPSATAFETLDVERPALAPLRRESRWYPRSPFEPATTTSDDLSKQADSAKKANKTVQITIDEGGFWPPRVEVPRGTTVEWTNAGLVPHQVMGADLAFEDSNLLRTDESFSRTLTEPGTYTYICGPHQYMIGTITVT